MLKYYFDLNSCWWIILF